jgi:hypothetical protein
MSTAGPGQEPLAVESGANGTVMPATPFAHPRRQTAFRMGVFDDRGRIVRGSLLQRSYGQVGFAADLPPATRSDQRSVVYAGHLSHHFGHFILESLSRLWFASQYPERPIVWACRPEPIPPAWHGWQRQILDVLGIRNEVLLLTEPTRFRSVDVPQPGYRVKDFFSRQHADFLAAYPARARDPDLRVWLSRSGTTSEYNSLHADRLEQQLAAHGWTIVQPETLPIVEQLELLATAGRVAGEQGSAFHLLVLLGDVRGLEVDVICRDPSRPVEEQNQNYRLIAEMRGLCQRLHVIPEEHVLARQGGKVRKDATTLAGHLEALGVPSA